MPKYTTGEDYYNKIYIVFNGLIAFTLAPFVIVFLNIQKYGSGEKLVTGQASYLLIIGLLISYAILFYVSLDNFKKGLLLIEKDSSLREKLDKYYSISLKKYSILNICCFLMVIGLFLTKYFLFTIGYILALIILSIGRPVLNTMIKEIPLSSIEIDILNNKRIIES